MHMSGTSLYILSADDISAGGNSPSKMFRSRRITVSPLNAKSIFWKHLCKCICMCMCMCVYVISGVMAVNLGFTYLYVCAYIHTYIYTYIHVNKYIHTKRS